MALSLLTCPNYRDGAGIDQLQQMQQALMQALAQQDWLEVRRLDRACAALVDRVIAANLNHGSELVAVLSELKDVYHHIIYGCQQKVASMAV